MKRWRVYRLEEDGSQTDLFWWPTNDDYYPDHPSGLMFEVVVTIEFPMLRALWSLRQQYSDSLLPFKVEYNPFGGYIQIDDRLYRWEREEDLLPDEVPVYDEDEPEQDTEVILPDDE